MRQFMQKNMPQFLRGQRRQRLLRQKQARANKAEQRRALHFVGDHDTDRHINLQLAFAIFQKTQDFAINQLKKGRKLSRFAGTLAFLFRENLFELLDFGGRHFGGFNEMGQHRHGHPVKNPIQKRLALLFDHLCFFDLRLIQIAIAFGFIGQRAFFHQPRQQRFDGAGMPSFLRGELVGNLTGGKGRLLPHHFEHLPFGGRNFWKSFHRFFQYNNSVPPGRLAWYYSNDSILNNFRNMRVWAVN
ncbi:MAG: hypothetical protein ILNGONEN_01409 [Syntrophorhabdaceae bacterium]|nr:hypothetical protein [Syntrophorhabdaceae bacterium]